MAYSIAHGQEGLLGVIHAEQLAVTARRFFLVNVCFYNMES